MFLSIPARAVSAGGKTWSCSCDSSGKQSQEDELFATLGPINYGIISQREISWATLGVAASYTREWITTAVV